MNFQSFLVPSFDNELLYAEVYGETKKPTQTIVFLHGLGGNSNAILATIEVLLKKDPALRCIIYDLRGHGFSTRHFPNQSIFLEKVGALDLQKISEFFHLTDPIFVGHSLGGIIIATYLQYHYQPAPLHSFLFCIPVYQATPSFFRTYWVKWLATQNHKVNPPTKKCQLEDFLLFQDSFDIDPKRLKSDIQDTGWSSWIGMWLASLGWKQPDGCLNRSDVTLIYGKDDFLLPANKQRKVLKKMDKLQNICLSSNHHQPYTKYPVEVTEIILSSLQTQL